MLTRPGFKVLGLSALVMGVMAIGTAGVAQAETGACWGYGSLKCFSAELEAAPLLQVEGGAATLLVGNVNMEVTCSEAIYFDVGTGATLSSNGSILKGNVVFLGCFSRKKTDLGALGACTPEDVVFGVGTILTRAVTGLIVLHNGQPVVLFKPVTGELLTTRQRSKSGVSWLSKTLAAKQGSKHTR